MQTQLACNPQGSFKQRLCLGVKVLVTKNEVVLVCFYEKIPAVFLSRREHKLTFHANPGRRNVMETKYTLPEDNSRFKALATPSSRPVIPSLSRILAVPPC